MIANNFGDSLPFSSCQNHIYVWPTLNPWQEVIGSAWMLGIKPLGLHDIDYDDYLTDAIRFMIRWYVKMFIKKFTCYKNW